MSEDLGGGLSSEPTPTDFFMTFYTPLILLSLFNFVVIFLITFFIRLFRITCFDEIHHFLMTLFFWSLRNDTDFFYLSPFAPTTYKNILGVAKDPFMRVGRLDLKEKMLGASPSMRFFHLGASRPRFGASRSRLDVTTRVDVRKIHIYIYI